MDQKIIFAKNLNYYLDSNQKTQKEVADLLGIGLSTFNSWCTGFKMPRMDKVQMLADYFSILKSDLIEDKQKTEPVTLLAAHYEGEDLLKGMEQDQIDDILEFIKYKKSQKTK